ncbi:unnamed protein product [Diamesa tonsa]
MDSFEAFSEATNYQYIPRENAKKKYRIFMNYVNSYHGKPLAKKILSLNGNVERSSSVEFTEDDEDNPEEVDENNLVYELCGTLQELEDVDREETTELQIEILNPYAETYFDSIKDCNLIIYDITQDNSQLIEANKFLKYLEKHFESNQETSPKYFILISTIMTWSQTVITSEEPLTDADYRKRRSHPCFMEHMLLEREVMNAQKRHIHCLRTLVVCPGIIYGGKEDILHFIFKKCYFNKLQIETFTPGSNFIPLIYLQDFIKYSIIEFIKHKTQALISFFSSIMISIIKSFPDKNYRYILVVQPENLTMKNVMTVLAEVIGGSEMRIKMCNKEQIFLMNEKLMTQRVFNHMTLNLRLESEFLNNWDFIMNGFNFELNTNKLAEEFYRSRNLKPIKILLDGSPFTYQRELAEMLSNYYAIHVVKHECFLENTNDRLLRKIKKAEEYLIDMEMMKQMQINEDPQSLENAVNYDEMLEEVKNHTIQWRSQSEAIPEYLTRDDISEPEFEFSKTYIMDRLKSFACSKHQGYVMQGFQLDRAMASYLFLQDFEAEVETSTDEIEFNADTKPDFVVILNRSQSSDPICENIEVSFRAEMEIESTVDEKQKLQKCELNHYNETHQEDVSLLNFFLDRDIIPMEITIDDDLNEKQINDIFESIIARIGPPRSYALTREELEEIQRLKREIAAMEVAERVEKEMKQAIKDQEEKERQLEDWTNQMMELKRQEIIEMEKRSLPVRHYLMKYILPNITEGLVEMTKLRPDNPTEYLAEYLFKHKDDMNYFEDNDLDPEVVREFQNIVKNSTCK